MEGREFITPLGGSIFLSDEGQEETHECTGAHSEGNTNYDRNQLTPPVKRGVWRGCERGVERVCGEGVWRGV